MTAGDASLMRHSTLAVLLLCCCLSTATAAPQVVQKWEYAQLLVTDDVGASWKTGAEYERSNEATRKASLYVVYKSLGGKLPIDNVAMCDVLNVAGDRGWELINVEKNGKIDIFLFKRPKN